MKTIIPSRTLKTVAAISTLVLAAATSVFGFGQEGHQAIAILAEQKLQADSAGGDEKAKTALAKIDKLLDSADLGSVAVWADWIRLNEVAVDKVSTSDIHDIDTRFPGNGDWHFINLPLNSDYPNDDVCPGPNDVVHGINKCIDLLENTDSEPHNKLSDHKVALMFLVHLVGDMHQPLHVSCGYYKWNSKTIVSDPEVTQAFKADNDLPHDRGGNNLLVVKADETGDGAAPKTSGDLHVIWDSDLVFLQAGKHSKVSGQVVAKALSSKISGVSVDTGDHHTWAAAWAKDSAAASVKAYTGIKVQKIDPSASHRQGEIPKTPMIGFDKAAYLTAHKMEEQQQIVKAAVRLAELLKAIQWHD